MAETRNGYFSKTRIEALSDGIFAIIVTLLVLEIKVPDIHDHRSMNELAKALWSQMPKVLSWIISFLIVCVIWVNHHRILSQLKIVTHSLFWLNANLLLWCSLIPFPTALMGDYAQNPVALVVFGVILALMAFSFSLIRFNALKTPYVLDESIDIIHYKKATTASIIFGPVLYLIGAVLSLVHPYLGFAIYAFVPLYFIFYNSAKTKED